MAPKALPWSHLGTMLAPKLRLSCAMFGKKCFKNTFGKPIASKEPNLWPQKYSKSAILLSKFKVFSFPSKVVLERCPGTFWKVFELQVEAKRRQVGSMLRKNAKKNTNKDKAKTSRQTLTANLSFSTFPPLSCLSGPRFYCPFLKQILSFELCSPSF